MVTVMPLNGLLTFLRIVSVLMHQLARFLHIDAKSRSAFRAAVLRLIHWKPLYYRRASEWGLARMPHSPRIIVSLTTYPARIGLVYQTINTLLNQRLKPDKIVLWLAESQFPNKEADLPESLLTQKKFGLEIDWCEDLWSYKKLIPALRKYPEDIIITVDDDLFYPLEMIQELVDSYEKDPTCVHTQSAMKMEFDGDGNPTRYRSWRYVNEKGAKSFSFLILGGTGTLYPPHVLDENVFDDKTYMKITPTTDDIWFWAMAAKAGHKVCVSHGGLSCANNYNANNDFALWNLNQSDGNGNDDQLRSVISRFGLGDRIRGEVACEGVVD